MLAPLLGGVFSFGAAQPPPGIVYIMADDLGYGEIGCFGQAKIPTPNIDRLAAEGVRLTRFYAASPVCAPTRCSLLTGKHQGHAAVRGNREQGGFGPNDPEGQFPLPASETTIAEVLRRAGYRTALIGKWGLGGPKPGESPLDHGFDRFYGYLCQRRAHNSYPAYLWNDRQPDLLAGNRVFDAHQKLNAPLSSSEDYDRRFAGADYGPGKIAEACKAFIRDSRGKPLFLYYAPNLPHAALQAPRPWIEKFPLDWDPKPYLGEQGYLPTGRPHATYAAMISYLDDTVGQIVKTLADEGRLDQTLIVFTSDNGATFNGGVDRAFFTSNGNLRDGKMSVYEGGIRVPFVARLPGRIPAGSESRSVATCYDSFATLAEFAGVAAPRTDGRSFLASLYGKPQQPRDFAFFEYPEATSMRAVVFGRFKVIWPSLKKDPNRIEAYDLDADPGEQHDLASQMPQLVKRAIAIAQKEHAPSREFPLPGVDRSPKQ